MPELQSTSAQKNRRLLTDGFSLAVMVGDSLPPRTRLPQSHDVQAQWRGAQGERTDWPDRRVKHQNRAAGEQSGKIYRADAVAVVVTMSVNTREVGSLCISAVSRRVKVVFVMLVEAGVFMVLVMMLVMVMAAMMRTALMTMSIFGRRRSAKGRYQSNRQNRRQGQFRQGFHRSISYT